MGAGCGVAVPGALEHGFALGAHRLGAGTGHGRRALEDAGLGGAGGWRQAPGGLRRRLALGARAARPGARDAAASVS